MRRTLDHANRKDPACPLCRMNLRGYLKFLNLKANQVPESMDRTKFSHTQSEILVTTLLNRLLLRLFPNESTARKKQVELDESTTGSMGQDCK